MYIRWPPAYVLLNVQRLAPSVVAMWSVVACMFDVGQLPTLMLWSFYGNPPLFNNVELVETVI